MFIQPPSTEILEDRLRKRGAESEDRIQMRVEKAKRELLTASEFDHIVVNDVLEDAVTDCIRLCTDFLNE
jgi:guanylate kinase